MYYTMTFLFKKTIGDGHITSLEELTKVPNIHFSIRRFSSSWKFFKLSPHPVARMIWEVYQVSNVTLWSQWRLNEINCGQYRKEVM